MNKKAQISIYLNEGDMIGELHLHEVVVRRLLHAHVAGATVVRGLMGYGKHNQVHRKHLLGISDDRPVIVTAVDDYDHLTALLPELKQLVPGRLIIINEVDVA